MTILVYGRSTPSFEISLMGLEKRIIYFDDLGQLFDITERELSYQLVIIDCENPSSQETNDIELWLIKSKNALKRTRFVFRSRLALDIASQLLTVGVDVLIDPECTDRLIISRIKSVLRRDRHELGNDWITCGNLQFSPKLYLAELDRQRIQLTLTEFKLLEFLINHQNKAVTREEIGHVIFGGGVRTERAVDVHMFNLKKKIGSTASLISTVRGYGYMLEIPDDKPHFLSQIPKAA